MDRAALYTALTTGAGFVILLGNELRLRIRTPSRASSVPARPPKPASDKGRTSPRTDPRLEAKLRSVILSSDARERLVGDAMKKTGGDRAAAVRKVLDDLHTENNRWS